MESGKAEGPPETKAFGPEFGKLLQKAGLEVENRSSAKMKPCFFCGRKPGPVCVFSEAVLGSTGFEYGSELFFCIGCWVKKNSEVASLALAMAMWLENEKKRLSREN